MGSMDGKDGDSNGFERVCYIYKVFRGLKGGNSVKESRGQPKNGAL